MSLNMDPQIRARWTTALRSGTIPQAKGALREDAGRCCLGVLADLAVADGVIDPPKYYDDDRESEGEWLYCGAGDVLPYAVYAWAGLPNGNPDAPGHTGKSLADLNDAGMPFTEIADLIDGGTS